MIGKGHDDMEKDVAESYQQSLEEHLEELEGRNQELYNQLSWAKDKLLEAMEMYEDGLKEVYRIEYELNRLKEGKL
jgi:hypothetical protein